MLSSSTTAVNRKAKTNLLVLCASTPQSPHRCSCLPGGPAAVPTFSEECGTVPGLAPVGPPGRRILARRGPFRWPGSPGCSVLGTGYLPTASSQRAGPASRSSEAHTHWQLCSVSLLGPATPLCWGGPHRSLWNLSAPVMEYRHGNQGGP